MPSKSQKTELKELILVLGLGDVFKVGICDGLLDEEETACFLAILEITRYMDERKSVPKSLHWLDTVLLNLDDKRFRAQLRMEKQAFCDFLLLLKDNKVFSESQVPLPMQLAVALYQFGTFGNASSIGNVATKFGIGEGTVENIMDRVISALTSMSSTAISWPTVAERKDISTKMAHQLLPKCVGFIDGSDAVLFQAPTNDKEVYWSRKKKYCIQFQVVCDVNNGIRHFCCGFPGSVHDARVFASSDLHLNSSKYFGEGEYLIGDSAYVCTDRMVAPFKRYRPLTPKQILFNKHISSHRVVVEHTIGILKGRIQSLQHLRIMVNRHSGHRKACRWIEACVILHNLLINRDSWTQPSDEVYLEPEPDTTEENVQQVNRLGEMKRQSLVEIISAMY